VEIEELLEEAVMAKLERRHAPVAFPDVFGWFDEPWAPWAPGRALRVEDYVRDGTYVLHAELPGVDPDKDVEITVEGGMLTIRAERREQYTEPHRCEFRHGSLVRSVTLPERADTEHITASYDRGILEITVPVPEAKAQSRRIEVTHG
jgi:HSP20 family molecular chaperone IbpA